MVDEEKKAETPKADETKPEEAKTEETKPAEAPAAANTIPAADTAGKDQYIEATDLKNALLQMVEMQKKEVNLLQVFVRGIISGFGVFIGSAVLVTIFLFLLSKLNTAPIIGGYVEKVQNTIKSSQGK